MADSFLSSCGLSGIFRNYDPSKDQNRHTTFLWYNAPISWDPILYEPIISLLFFAKEDFNLEQKKTTSRVVF